MKSKISCLWTFKYFKQHSWITKLRVGNCMKNKLGVGNCMKNKLGVGNCMKNTSWNKLVSEKDY